MSANSERDAPRTSATETTPARLLPGRFPLLWVLAPLVAAYLVAESGVRFPEAALWCVATLLTAGSLFAPKFSRPYAVWAACFSGGLFALGSIWHAARCPPPPDRSGLPPREAVLSVRVDELFNTRFDAVSGLGMVTGAPPHLAELSGMCIQFRVTKHGGDPRLDLGAVVSLRGVLDNAPSGDGFARYLRARGASCTLSRAKLERVEVSPGAFRLACTRARSRVAAALAEGVDAEGAARLSALMLGRTGLLPAAERSDFQKAGATHLFAISGLHITGIAAGLIWASRRLRVPDGLALPVVLGALWAYVQMAGAPPSAMRAWVMAAAMFGARVLNRGARPASGLALAAVVMLIVDPSAMRAPGFLLSYVVVAAMIWHAVPAARELETRIQPWSLVPRDALGLWRRLALKARSPVFAACSATFAATTAGAPLTAALFGNVAPIGLVANLALVPLAGPPVLTGFVSSALAIAWLPAWAAPFNRFGAFLMDLLACGAHLAAIVPGGAFTMDVAASWATPVASLAVLAALLAAPPRPDRSPWRYAVMPLAAFVVFVALLFFG